MSARRRRTFDLRVLAALGVALACWTVPARGQDASRVLVRSDDAGPYGPLAEDRGAVGLWQRIQKARTTASVLYTAGHPDDEEAGVLTLLGRGLGARTALLTLNRGEGGANALGPELFDALGLVRTEELRLAGRYYGLDDQYFTTAVDYGYSKTLEEAFRSWDREAVLEDMVRILRTNRPFVVISRWHGSARDGHGHHQASGVLTPEAVEAAADPARFPEQIAVEGLRPWRVRKLYRGGIRPGEEAHLTLRTDVPSPWLGESYLGCGAYGLSLQRSQTQGRVRRTRGGSTRYERLLPGGEGQEEGMFDGLDTSLSGVLDLVGEPASAGVEEALAQAERHVERAAEAFRLTEPWATAPHLARAAESLERAARGVAAGTDAAFVIEVELREVHAALRLALGLDLEATAVPRGVPASAPMGEAVAGQELDVHVDLRSLGAHRVRLVGARLESDEGWPSTGTLAAATIAPGDGAVSGTFQLSIPADAEPSRPWFYRPAITRNRYSVRDSAEIHLGESRPRVRAVATIEYEGRRLRLASPVHTIEPLAPYGTARRVLTVVPALSVQIAPSSVILPTERTSATVTVEVRSSAPAPLEASIDLDLPRGWSSEPPGHALTFAGPGESDRVSFTVTPGRTPDRAVPLRARATADGRIFTEGYERIAHRELAPTRLYADATADVVPVEVRVAADLVVGYVMGVGDDVPAGLRQLGAEVRLLTEEELDAGALGGLDAIVVGTRAYAVRPDLVANNRRLLEWVREGGHLVVLYQTQEFTPETQAAHPATLPGAAEEVSEEDAPVTILAPDHALLATPNRIGPADFEGWVEQRGSKFFATWAPAYTPLVETHDTGQPPQEGVWLSAPVGSGHYTYVALALHRQLPYGVPGAYRILANLVSLGR